MLIAMAGLPGSGKSFVAYGLSSALGVPVLSVDPVEAAIVRAGVDPAEPVGLAAYVVVEALARDLLELGQSVIVDAVNAVEPARRMWRELAASADVPLRVIEVTCSDEELHRTRLEARDRGERALHEPSWDDVRRRQIEFEPWLDPRLVLDTAEDPDTVLTRALAYLETSPVLPDQLARVADVPRQDPLGTDPLGTDPLDTDPLGTDPLGTDPLGTDPLDADSPPGEDKPDAP